MSIQQKINKFLFSRSIAFLISIFCCGMTYSQGKTVDLGLSVLWCESNYGATSVEDVGDHLSWHECDSKQDKNGCRMPNYQEIEELLTKCRWTYVRNFNDKNIDGYIVSSNVSGYEGNYIFLPCAGLYENGAFFPGGHYWSNSSEDDISDLIALPSTNNARPNYHLGIQLIGGFCTSTKEYQTILATTLTSRCTARIGQETTQL